jgi:hypothetical protein
MPNGRPGDHPLTDLLKHGREVYGPEADACIRAIAALSEGHELDDWWSREIAPEEDPAAILRKAKARLERLRAP